MLSAAIVAPAQTIDNSPAKKAQILDRISTILTKAAYVPGVDFAKWPTFLEENREAIDKANDDSEFQRAVNKALFEFGTSHIVMTTPKQSQQRMTNSTVGIGISSQQTEEGLLIVRTVKGAAAESAGIVAGDIITAVDGQKVEGIRGIPGEEGTNVTVTVKRADGTVKDFVLTRKKFSTVRPEELIWDSPDTARLVVYTFDYSYSRKNVEALMTQAKGAKNLILDLRDNGGGAVVNLEHLLGLFMNPDQPIGTFISKEMVDDYIASTHGDSKDLAAIARWSTDKIRPDRNRRMAPYHGNVMVFVNGLSGSASEIAAAALQENVGAKIIGTKSAGAVLVSVIVDATNGFMLQYPLSDYITLRGKRLEGNGVTPDVLAEDPVVRLQTSKDACVEAALKLLAENQTTTKS
jgi:carboxyl-terminal processing protease